MLQLWKKYLVIVVYDLPEKSAQLMGIFVLCINEFHLLAEIIPCHKAEALSTLQIQACNFSGKAWHYFWNYTYIPCASSGTGGFHEYKWVCLELLCTRME